MVKFIISADELPTDWSGKPQQLLESFLDRLSVIADAREFGVGDVAPEDGRPWFKNGTQLWVWNGSAYEPASTDASILPQVAISDIEPDITKYEIWLKTAGNTVLGLYVYLGSTTGWVTNVTTIEPLSITTAKLANNAVTTSIFGPLSVTGDKLASNIPTSKWELGPASAYLRMSLDASTPLWDRTNVVSSDIDLNFTDALVFEHNLGATPQFVEALWVNVTADLGWVPGDTVPLCGTFTESSGHAGYLAPGVFKSATRVYTRLLTDLKIAPKSGGITAVADISKWKLRFRLTAS